MMNWLLAVCVMVTVSVAVSEASALRFKPFEKMVNKMTQLTQGQTVQETTRINGIPAFCRKLKCPSFTVLKTTKDYEERRYAANNWVTTSATGIDLDSVQYKLFMRLFRYIQGNNAKKEKIDMTVPVTMKIVPGQGPACVNNFTMSFYLAPSVGKGPKPSDPAVYLTTSKPFTVYVRSFKGFAREADWPKEVKELSGALGDKGFATNYYYTAGYDSPFTFLNRHNEVWLVKV